MNTFDDLILSLNDARQRDMINEVFSDQYYLREVYKASEDLLIRIESNVTSNPESTQLEIGAPAYNPATKQLKEKLVTQAFSSLCESIRARHPELAQQELTREMIIAGLLGDHLFFYSSVRSMEKRLHDQISEGKRFNRKSVRDNGDYQLPEKTLEQIRELFPELVESAIAEFNMIAQKVREAELAKLAKSREPGLITKLFGRRR